MHIEAQNEREENPFDHAREKFEELVDHLTSPPSLEATHSEIESLIQKDGMEVMRLLFQGHLDARGLGEADREVVHACGGLQTHVRIRTRRIMSVFGPVELRRTGYGTRGESFLFPRDAELNLPEDSYSFGSRKRVAVDASKNSFEETVQSVRQSTGANVPKRQAEELVERAAVDFDAFYEQREVSAQQQEESGCFLVISVDRKGVVMRKEDLREETRQAAEKRTHKLRTKLSPGEKRNAKRMATVASVYTIEPYCRRPEDIVEEVRGLRRADKNRPSPEDKRVWASLAKSLEEVIDEAFQEALRRDPERKKHWVGLVDGDPTQIKILQDCARAHGVEITIILDLMHVLTYLWKASHAFHADGSKESEQWVREKLREILEGKAGYVAGGIRRSATLRGVTGPKRKAVDKCCDYICNHTRYMEYNTYLAVGFPIATGVIEGACRYLIKDRMDVTGARWSLRGAEAVLRIRALRSSGDFEDYWRYHEEQELHRNHTARYQGGVPATRKPCTSANRSRAHLRLVT